jgi:hypothetical protein
MITTPPAEQRTPKAFVVERLVRARRNYARFLHTDYGHAFHEWLGIDSMPVFVRDDWWHRGKIRMVRKVYHPTFHEIAGEWCDTRNAAKASYKLALKARRSSHPNRYSDKDGLS